MNKYLGLLFLLLTFPAHSAQVLDAKITSIYCGYPESYQMCSVAFDKAIEQRDSCNTITANRMQFSINSDTGKSLLSLGLTAYTTQKSVNVYSTGACTVYQGLSDIQYIELIN